MKSLQDMFYERKQNREQEQAILVVLATFQDLDMLKFEN